MKKFLAIILVVILALGVVACKKEGPWAPAASPAPTLR